MKTLRCIYVNSFNRPGFLAQVSKKLQKMQFFHNLRTITQERNMETRQMTQYVHLLFPLILFVTLIFVSEKSKNSFSCGPSFDPFLSVKYLNFGQKLPIGTAHLLFQKIDTLGLLKINIMFCSQRVDEIRYQFMDCKYHKHAQQLIQNLTCFCHNSGCYVTVSCTCVMGLNQTLIRRKS